MSAILKEESAMSNLEEARMQYPRVSDIIGKQSRSDFEGIPLEALLNAQIRGNKLHAYATAYLKGLWLPSIEEQYQPYFDAFTEWADNNIHQTLFTGVRLYDDENRFTGEFDIIAVLKDSKQIALLDLKTSANVSKSWPIQLAAYKHLCELNGYEIETVFNIHLKKGKFNVKAISIEHPDLSSSWEIFKSALKCFDYFERKEKKS